jgi:ketosteroid isomerase-like protein
VNSKAKSDTSLDRSKIAAVRRALNQAVNRSEARELTDLLTDDVVAVHEDGRCMCGKQEVEVFFRHAFERYDIEAAILSSDVIIHDKWAIEMDEVSSVRASFEQGAPIKARFKAVFVFGRQPDSSWKIARIMELLE